MIIHEINGIENTKVIDILKSGITESLFSKPELYENYLYSYKDNPANLFYRLEKGAYKPGGYFVIADENDQYIASAGWNELRKDTALLLTRMLVSLPYRTSYILGEKILPLLIQKTKSYDKVWMTCNEYNIAIYKWFLRKDAGKSSSVHRKWPDIYNRFKPIGKHVVNGTQQYVVQLER